MYIRYILGFVCRVNKDVVKVHYIDSVNKVAYYLIDVSLKGS